MTPPGRATQRPPTMLLAMIFFVTAPGSPLARSRDDAGACPVSAIRRHPRQIADRAVAPARFESSGTFPERHGRVGGSGREEIADMDVGFIGLGHMGQAMARNLL